MPSAYYQANQYAPQYGYQQPQYVQQSMQQNYVQQHAVMGNDAPWEDTDLQRFLTTCQTLKVRFTGRNWSDFRFDFTGVCRVAALQGFLEAPAPYGNGYPFPVNDPKLASKYLMASTAVYTGLRNACAEVVKYKLKPFADKYYPAAEAWNFLCREYSSEENMGQNELIHQMTKLRMIPGEADEYIAEKLRLRDQLYAVNYPVTKISFNDFLVQGLPEEWETFKTTMRGVIRSLTE